ncbi:MAG TPA: DUF2911 domain-containing protein [Flavipsychrobacter sp.]|nr:DUF2911 domain-containing protein [Flavipsychrobacter sp.]
MNKLFLFFFLAIAHQGLAQTADSNSSPATSANAVKLPEMDKSPMDMAYFPDNYPVLKIQGKATDPLVARVIYSRPQKEQRTVFGGLVEYGKVWRLGANEATEIELYRDVKVKDKKLSKGRYTIYAIPTETRWTVIFNKDTDVWGAFKYDEKKDALRVDIPLQKAPVVAEAFSISFARSANGADMIVAWDEAMATIPFAFK